MNLSFCVLFLKREWASLSCVWWMGFFLFMQVCLFPAFCSWVALCFSNVFFFLLFVCLLALQVVLKGGDLHWVSGSENQNSWRENGLNLSTICAFSFLSCSCFLPFAFYLESFFFGTCPLERALVCVWKTVKESISRATSQAIQETRGGGWHAALLDGFVFLYYSFFSLKDHMKREWKREKKSVKCFGSRVVYLVGTSIYCPYRAQWRNLISVTLAFSCAVVRKANKEASKDTSLSGLRRHFTCLGSKLSFMNEVEVPNGKFLHCVNDYWLGKSSMAVETARCHHRWLEQSNLFSFSLSFFEPKREKEKHKAWQFGCLLVLFLFSWLFGMLQCLGDWKELEKCTSVFFGFVCFLLGVASWKKKKKKKGKGSRAMEKK